MPKECYIDAVASPPPIVIAVLIPRFRMTSVVNAIAQIQGRKSKCDPLPQVTGFCGKNASPPYDGHDDGTISAWLKLSPRLLLHHHPVSVGRLDGTTHVSYRLGCWRSGTPNQVQVTSSRREVSLLCLCCESIS